MRLLWTAALAATLLAACCCETVADTPTGNLDEVFSLTREYLWQMDDYYWHRGDYERCISVLRLITQVDPQDTDAYGSAAWLIQNQLRDDEAEALLMEGVRRNPEVYDLHFELGFFYYMHERFDEAVASLENAVLFDAEPRVWHILAHSYELAGDVSQSLNIWADCQSVEPANPVPSLQIERILSGGEPPGGPAMAARSREQRRRESGRH